MFIKNPDNISKCLILGVLFLFASSYFSIPSLIDKPATYILDWLAYNRGSRLIVITGTLSFLFFVWVGMRYLRIQILGKLSGVEEKQLQDLILEMNPILHISIIYMTDIELISNKFDLALWVTMFFIFSTFRVFIQHSLRVIKL